MKECVNCTATQMQTMAKNQPVGYQFVYDLAHNVIRKYEVYLDSNCAPEGGASSGPAGGAQHCGSFKGADEITPVDPGVQAIFNSLRATWLVNPQLANTAKSTVSGFPIDSDTGQPTTHRKWRGTIRRAITRICSSSCVT